MKQTQINEEHINEEWENDFPSLDYDKVVSLVKSIGLEIVSDYYDYGFDAEDSKGKSYFVGVSDKHITVTGEDGQSVVYLIWQ